MLMFVVGKTSPAVTTYTTYKHTRKVVTDLWLPTTREVNYDQTCELMLDPCFQTRRSRSAIR